ncbi:hypothetical protein ACHAPT_012176 [Fusarium lateritium]
MSETEPRPEPPVIKHKGFRLTNWGFGAATGDVARKDGSRLRVLFNPGSLRLKRDQKEAQEAAKVLNKKQFLAATGSAEGRRILRKNAIKSRHQLFYSDWKWNAVWHPYIGNDEAFSRCTTPGERANCDLGRFMNYYFLTDGQPDPTKTPTAFAVYGFDGRSRLHAISEKIPGLSTCSGGSDESRTLCIGWDCDAVSRLARSIDRQAHEEEKKKQESKWEKAMEAHENYVSKSSQGSLSQGNKKRTTKGKASRSFELGRCKGSYVIKCDTVSDGWSMSDFTMDICEGKRGTLIADYDFGVIQGTMLMSDCEETLDALAGTGDDSGEAWDSEEYGTDYGEMGSEDEDGPKAKKRLAKGVGTRKKAGPAPKRRKIAPSLARRVYYRLRGLETGEGQILSDPESGHLDFLSNSCATFVGLAYHLPYQGKNVEFRGYKVSDVPKKKAGEWDDFSWEAYESARKGRWH